MGKIIGWCIIIIFFITMEKLLNSHSTISLKREISKRNLKGYSKLKKKDLVRLILNNRDRFNDLGKYIKPLRVKRTKKKKRTGW